MDIRLDGRRALVTGGNSGIGEAIALALAEAGADVAINYVAHRQRATDVVERIERHGVRGLALRADVSDRAAVDAMFDVLDGYWGGLDLLVVNAGIDGPRAVAWESDPAAWERVIRTNLIGAYYCARAALQRMVPARDGVVLCISSVHETIPWHGYSAYAASKAGLSMFVKTLAQETADEGVRVLAIAPGAVRTAINRDVWSSPAGARDLESKIPEGRLATPAEIAAAAVFLCSSAASYVTGTTLFVDGGMTLYPAFRHGG